MNGQSLPASSTTDPGQEKEMVVEDSPSTHTVVTSVSTKQVATSTDEGPSSPHMEIVTEDRLSMRTVVATISVQQEAALAEEQPSPRMEQCHPSCE